MTAQMTRLLAASISLAALVLALAPTAPRAQTPTPGPAIILPPLPDVDVNVVPLEAPPKPAQIQQPAPSTAPAVSSPVVVETTSPPRPAASPAPAEAAAIVAAPPLPPAAPEQAAPAPLPAPPVQNAAPLAPPAAAPVAAADIAPALRAALEASAKEPLPRNLATQKLLREQIFAAYAERDFAPFWLRDGAWSPTARGALARLAKAGEDGLDLKASPAPTSPGTDEKSRVAAELALTQAVVAYGYQASGGRINPRAIAHLITEKPEVAEPGRILAAVALGADADAALAAFNPLHAGYRALRAKLAELRASRPLDPVRISAGPTLRVGMKDARVPSIRERFALNSDPSTVTDELVYDARVAAAVADYQRDKGLIATGMLNPVTVAALSEGDPAKVESEIIANMERWRWLPRADNGDRIEVNIPDYTVRVVQDGKVVHTARVVVGKPDTPTPVFSNRMQFLEVNPYWNVPQSIIKNEMLPRLASDPGYLQRQGYEVSRSRKGELIVRQPPGNRNALGNIKFMFPNEHAVYLHDTPSRSLFANPRRAYSHGCVRVDQPFKFAEILLGTGNGWNEDRVKKLIGKGNRTIQLPRHIDIHIEYFTAFVDEAGQLQMREDIYGYSRKLKAAMGLAG